MVRTPLCEQTEHALQYRRHRVYRPACRHCALEHLGDNKAEEPHPHDHLLPAECRHVGHPVLRLRLAKHRMRHYRARTPLCRLTMEERGQTPRLSTSDEHIAALHAHDHDWLQLVRRDCHPQLC